MIKESEPIRTQENASSLIPTAAAEYAQEEGKSMKPPPYQLSSDMNGGEFVGAMSKGLGTSLKDKKVVRNSPKASALGTKAFAEGNKIHFSPGEYQPDTKSGQDMLGHEIVHSVQQSKGW